LRAQEEDDELFDLIGAVGAGINASKDERLPVEVRQVAADVADNAADRLTQFRETTTSTPSARAEKETARG
jgi:hypothetical protein